MFKSNFTQIGADCHNFAYFAIFTRSILEHDLVGILPCRTPPSRDTDMSVLNRLASRVARTLLGEGNGGSTNIDDSEGPPRTFVTSLHELSSQGLTVSPDQSAAYYHGSTRYNCHNI